MRQPGWRRPDQAIGQPARVAVVTVNYNTRDLIALLLWSFYRVMERRSAFTVVVVDNGSVDGSARMLADFSAVGLCTVLENDRNLGHGRAEPGDEFSGAAG